MGRKYSVKLSRFPRHRFGISRRGCIAEGCTTAEIPELYHRYHNVTHSSRFVATSRLQVCTSSGVHRGHASRRAYFSPRLSEPSPTKLSAFVAFEPPNKLLRRGALTRCNARYRTRSSSRDKSQLRGNVPRFTSQGAQQAIGAPIRLTVR